MAVRTYKESGRIQLSKNFNSYEFRCGLGRPCPCEDILIDDQLWKYLQQIADFFGATVHITSGYRCPDYNRSIGGSTGSYHSRGMAADIVVEGVAPRRVAAYAESIGIKGIGLYETDKDGHFTHIDTRTYKAFWYGQGQAYRATFGGAAAAGNPSSSTNASSGTTASSYPLKQFIEDVQRACGAGVDGIAGPKTLAATVTISKSKNRRHKAVVAIQKRLKALGYTVVGKADGVAGNKFDDALKAFQLDHDCVVDGEATKGAETWKKLLGMA